MARMPERLPGYGDEATWPECTGHPLDPRTDDGWGEEEDPAAEESDDEQEQA